jgi:hypothetical protein
MHLTPKTPKHVMMAGCAHTRWPAVMAATVAMAIVQDARSVSGSAIPSAFTIDTSTSEFTVGMEHCMRNAVCMHCCMLA